MDLGLAGKVAIVTGGSEGIGKATVRSLAREGARVVACARREDVLRAAADEIAEDTGGEVVPLAADVRRPEDVTQVVGQSVERFGRLDILVNNAGTSRALPFESATDEVWQEDLDLKVFGAIRMIRAALPHLRAAGGGSIVNLLNIGAKQPGPRSLPTTASRGAGLAITKALSKELAADHIRVNAVLIGLVKAGQHETNWRAQGSQGTLEEYYQRMAQRGPIPLGRVAESGEAGDLIAFLSSPRAAYITGVAVNFDGGTSAVV
jgi:NAD(P)-dependent dehydrogenase (short-subunit alcohol dehydrogenase family)